VRMVHKVSVDMKTGEEEDAMVLMVSSLLAVVVAIDVAVAIEL